MEEERRLAFVAVTRAEKRLFLSDSEGRNLDGSYRFPSRFVLGIDRKYVDYETEPDENLVKEARERIALSEKYMPSAADTPQFAIGDKVVHFMALALFLICERSSWQVQTMPVGRCVMRMAESVLLTCWPPAPLER